MVVVGAVTALACATVSDDDATSAARTSTESPRTSSSRNRGGDAGLAAQDSGLAIARVLRDAGGGISQPPSGAGRAIAAEPDAEVDSDVDAGLSEFEDPIARDCMETRRCDNWQTGTLDSCVASSRRALRSAMREARRRFLTIVMRCGSLRGCDYVSCARQP